MAIPSLLAWRGVSCCDGGGGGSGGGRDSDEIGFLNSALAPFDRVSEALQSPTVGPDLCFFLSAAMIDVFISRCCCTLT
jgi:hypothetical protein